MSLFIKPLSYMLYGIYFVYCIIQETTNVLISWIIMLLASITSFIINALTMLLQQKWFIHLELFHAIINYFTIALCFIERGLSSLWHHFMTMTNRKRIIMDREDKEPYMVRYYMFLLNRNKQIPFNVFIHHFIKGDDDHVHDHPWGYFTLILTGGYYETVYNTTENTVKTYWRAPGFYQVVTSKHTHKIFLKEDTVDTWTLFIPFTRVKAWGFMVKQKDSDSVEWVDAGDYLKEKQH